MGALRNFGQLSLLLYLPLLTSIVCDVMRGEQEGYYAFEEAPSRLMRPPQVRKPPYMMSSIPCLTGEGYHSKRPSPKFTLCGDLNKGFIPLNPMGQEFGGQPYPFELIKNKTLVFLSKALPYLKQDPKIPKVSKISESNYKPQGYRRHRNRRADEAGPADDVMDNVTTARQSCDQGGATGLLCSLQSVMSNNKIPLALMTAVAQSLAQSMSPTTQAPAAQQEYASEAPLHLHNSEATATSEGGMAEAVMGLLGTLANMASSGGAVKDSSLNEEEPSTLAHVMSVLTGASPGSGSALSLVLKLMASDASPLKALTSATRRRRPAEDQHVAAASETTAYRRPLDGGEPSDLPPTPCPSGEEYVTPAFARNYQGVWKYVVQIPQEGYFTQTVQQTKCLKGRCDFTEGICHESPRWVSLLVAETYYPDSFLPSPAPPTALPPPPPPVEDFYNFQQYLRRRVGEEDDEDTVGYRARPVYKKNNSLQHCDGVDSVGCYVVRLYYDWFLVNGSCKCWKPSPKRVLTGR